MNIFLSAILSFFLIQNISALSLYHDDVYRPFIADKKAYLMGDLLTVLIIETSNAQTSADLSSSKDIKSALEASYNKRPQEVGFGLRGMGERLLKQSEMANKSIAYSKN